MTDLQINKGLNSSLSCWIGVAFSPSGVMEAVFYIKKKNHSLNSAPAGFSGDNLCAAGVAQWRTYHFGLAQNSTAEARYLYFI